MPKNILVVDDDPHIQDLVSHFLEPQGFIISVCGDGYAAAEIIGKNTFDLIILDISMPYINGIQTLSRIRSETKTKDVPVMLLTVDNDLDTVMRAKRFGATEYVIKPPQSADLIARVERILNRKKIA